MVITKIIYIYNITMDWQNATAVKSIIALASGRYS
jgi:hypothetical protein